LSYKQSNSRKINFIQNKILPFKGFIKHQQQHKTKDSINIPISQLEKLSDKNL